MARPGASRYPALVRTIPGVALALPLVVALAAPVRAHVAPAVDANNRYLKLTPMRDRVRLAYTVYVGEIPGAQARLRMDKDRDGTLSEAESRVYGDEIAAGVIKDLQVTWDGAPYELAWSEIHMGMGTPVTNAGSFSIDLIAWICGDDRAAHSLVLFDRYRLPRPGETEVRLQQSPGITITRSALGRESNHSQLDYKWQGNDGPMAQLGWFVDFDVDLASATPAPAGECGAHPAGRDQAPKQRRAAVAIAAAALIVLAIASLIWWRTRRSASA